MHNFQPRSQKAARGTSKIEWRSMPTKHFADLPDRDRDLWRVTYADPPANWLQQVQIYRERQTGEAWGAIAIRHQCSVAAVHARYRVVAEHLEKLAETEGIVSAATKPDHGL